MKNHGQENTIAEEEIRQLREILASAEAVVIGAGSGLSTSAGYTYSGKRFETYFGDFAHRYGFSDMYTGGLLSLRDQRRIDAPRKERTMTRREQLHFLIAALQKEMPEYAADALPEDEAAAFDLFRTLCNVRRPGAPKLPEAFYAVEGDVLRAMTEAKGVTAGNRLPPVKADPRLSLWQGDITTLKVDAIVNAANSQMLGCFVPHHRCIDNEIHTMAGVELREKCFEIMQAQGHEEPTGQAKITPGYHLPAKYVLHTVGPIVSGSLTKTHRSLLASCYRTCLDLAAEYECRTVAFCCISTGVFLFPNQPAAEIAVKTVRQYYEETGSQLNVIFNVFKDEDFLIYHRLLS